MGAWAPSSTWPVVGDAPSKDSRTLGSQSSPGLFGVTDRCHAEYAASLTAKGQSSPQSPDRPRIVGGLSFGQQRFSSFAEEAEVQYEAHLAEIAEACSHQLDAEADRFACSFAGAGYTEYLMACEG